MATPIDLKRTELTERPTRQQQQVRVNSAEDVIHPSFSNDSHTSRLREICVVRSDNFRLRNSAAFFLGECKPVW
ncbi:unnamed protein product [Timema podura]|uniref:Uncharacterized protein n=1 Tax=Timema podura TaxID=61482 RepID=A0ABN7NR99_TIMPD|nr:unnamed protein product [Timema podura]